MSQFRLARLALMIAALGASSALMTNAVAQKKEDQKPAAAEQKGPSVRPEVYKLIDPTAVKQLMDAKNYTEVQNRITQAQAIPNLTPYEQYAIVRMRVSLAAATSNDAELVSSLGAAIDSGFLSPGEKDNFLLSLGTTYYNQKNWPKAVEAFRRYQKEGSDPSKVTSYLIRAEYLNNDFAGAKNDLVPYIQSLEKAGKTPSEEDLKLLASAANKVKDEATYSQALDQMVTYYPSDDYWTDAISRGVLRKPGYNGQLNDVNVYRLSFNAIQKMSPDAYTDFASLLLTDGFPTEAKKVMDAGFAQGVLTDAKAKQLRDKATKGAADDARNIASGEASATKSKNGAGLVNIGWAYVTMGQYDKGIGFIQQGIAKGGLKQTDEAKLRLGIAQFRAGHKDDAIRTLQDVKASGGLSDLARYWIILINHPTKATDAAK
ncbi:MAG: tetratricopeptide repeat protein [Telluria sp.]